MRETAGTVRRPVLDPVETRARIVAAARECFLRYGVQRTAMADVAEAAGISRAALYRIVPNASELVEDVVVTRVAEIAEELRGRLEQAPSFAEAVVQVCLEAVEGARHDKELQNFFATSASVRVHRMLAGDFPAIAGLVQDLFRPAFSAARASGELRTDASDAQLAEWLQSVMLMLIMREDLGAAEAEATLRTFLLPSLGLRDGGQGEQADASTYSDSRHVV